MSAAAVPVRRFIACLTRTGADARAARARENEDTGLSLIDGHASQGGVNAGNQTGAAGA